MKERIINLIIVFICFFLIININTIANINLLYENSEYNYELDNIFLENEYSKISDIIQMINESLILGYLEDLVDFSPRNTGTYGCEKAAFYIYEKFLDMGLDTKMYDWESFGNRFNPRFFTGKNIEATLEGNSENEEIIIFNAHYDSVRISPGADDDGSGVASVLAIAHILSKFEFDRTIKFLCFSGEEEGLLGSKDYSKYSYENNDLILIEFNADMIGYAKTDEDEKKLRVIGTNDLAWYIDVIDNLNFQYNFNFEITRGTLSADSRGGSDYYSFTRYGYEAIAFFEGQWNLNMHTKNDDIENMNMHYLTKTSQLIAASIAYICDMEIPNPIVYIENPRKGFLYFEGRKLGNLNDKRDDQLRTIVVDDVWIWANVLSDVNLVDRVEFYYKDRIQYTDYDYPYKWHLNKFSYFNQRIEIVVYDIYDNSASDWMDILYINPRIMK
jgi:hypothetical protein